MFFDEIYGSNLLKFSKMPVHVDSQRLARNASIQSFVKYRHGISISMGTRSSLSRWIDMVWIRAEAVFPALQARSSIGRSTIFRGCG
jgi:hypothetical protein